MSGIINNFELAMEVVDWMKAVAETPVVEPNFAKEILHQRAKLCAAIFISNREPTAKEIERGLELAKDLKDAKP